MSLTFLVGGARSGKSALAVRLASAWDGPVIFLATAEARDDPELAARIARHRLERPAGWRTVEVPVDLHGELGRVPGRAFVVVDCLTLWTANALESGWSDEDVERAAADTAALAAGRPSPTVVVSNEIGMGVIPATPLGRSFRDLLGRVNAVFADRADRACLVVAGRTLELT
ncbi:MAG TPA: bifunctional adenosylcobinamide kinase/adenosylcobinamide-phosphate guanylyltransferase [Gaiellaceae bacterium]|nr:bifunctional adenosylcobinamide kinase/adenosylcobinamide-phosphate guanylyltransferase [Gaiellaceae bacterium]